MNERMRFGAHGETVATDYLQRHGFRILGRNWRCHAGELDIIAVDGAELVVVEVKARRDSSCGHPFEALTPSKLARLRRLAALWSVAHQWRGNARIDAIAVTGAITSDPAIEHLRGIA